MMGDDAVSDLLGPGVIDYIRLDLTTRCNLRCVYCAVSQADYQGFDMAPDIVEKAKQAIVDLARHNSLVAVDVNGHGETTIVEGWEHICGCSSLMRFRYG